MCGRAVQARTEKFGELIAHWLYPETFEPRWNLRPTEPAWIVARRSDGATRTIQARWWCQWDGARQFETKFPMFNARVETMYDRKLWADLLQRGQRCIFPVNSFYEWPIKGKGLPPEAFSAATESIGGTNEVADRLASTGLAPTPAIEALRQAATDSFMPALHTATMFAVGVLLLALVIVAVRLPTKAQAAAWEVNGCSICTARSATTCSRT